MQKDIKKKTAKNAENRIKPKEINKKNKRREYLIFGIITVLAFILYGNSIPNDYAYDDGIVITKNEFTKKGIAGISDIFKYDSFYGEPVLRDNNLVAGGRYRPLSIVSFAMEYQFFGLNPHISHFVNILLLILTVFFIYKLVNKYLIPEQAYKWYFSVASVTALLFLFHPVHTETVDNIKGRDDLLCLLFSIIATLYSFKYINSCKIKELISVFISLFLALLSKENAITFVMAIPLMVYFFGKNTELKKYLLLAIPLVASAVLFLIIRQVVLGSFNSNIVPNLLSNSFIEATTMQKYTTIILTFGLYLKLLFIPHPLTYDYYPYHIKLASFGDIGVLISIIIWLGLLFLALRFFTEKRVISFSIIYFIATISVMSNILFPVGVFMSERFLYMPSFAFCLLMAYYIVVKLPSVKGIQYKYIISAFIIIILLFSLKTITRNNAWASNKTLFATDVRSSSGSVKSNYDYAINISEEAEKSTDIVRKTEFFEKSLAHLRKSLSIYPRYQAAIVSYADISYKYRQNADTTILFYEKALSLNPKMKNINNTLGTLYGQFKADYEKAIMFFKKDIELNAATSDTYKKLAMCYLFKRDSVNALFYTNKGLQLDIQNAELLQLKKNLFKTSAN